MRAIPPTTMTKSAKLAMRSRRFAAFARVVSGGTWFLDAIFLYFAGITGNISHDGLSPPECMLFIAPAL